MLKLFEVEGFKNFNDKITFDFSDVRDYRFNTECISNGLLGKTIVYGKNSVGKTNLGLAMFDIVTHLTTNNVDLDLYENYMCSIEFYNFLSEGIRFHYIFSFGSNIIDYVYTRDFRQNLLYKKIEINSKLLFEYSFADKSGNLEALQVELKRSIHFSTGVVCHAKRKKLTSKMKKQSAETKKISGLFANKMALLSRILILISTNVEKLATKMHIVEKFFYFL